MESYNDNKQLKNPLNRDVSEIENQTDIGATEIYNNTEMDSDTPEKNLKITSKYQFDGLTNLSIWGYSLGHFYNDLCAAIWFNYLVFYIKKVRNMPSIAPWSLLGGQIFDGLATPTVGILSDKTNTKIGKRTPWYIFGTIVVTCTYLPIFIYQFLPEDSSSTVKFAYMVSFPSLFNIGWASVQISNMSLVPSLTCSNTRRDILNSRRNTFTFVANLLVLSAAFVFFQLVDDGRQAFEYLAITVVTVGMTATLFFSSTVREVKLVKRANECLRKLKKLLEVEDCGQDNLPNNIKSDSDKVKILSQKSNKSDGDKLNVISSELLKRQKNEKKRSMGSNEFQQLMLSGEDDMDFEVDKTGKVQQSISSMKLKLKVEQMKQKSQEQQSGWKMWFSESMFYTCGAIYMFVRLYCNVIASMMPFYLDSVLKFGSAEQLKIPFQQALIPMLLYVFSTIASSFVEVMFQKIGRKKTYFIGAFLGAITTVGYIFIEHDRLRWLIYPIAALTGIAQALCLNTGITLISDVIGCRGSQGAFVFGVYSFLDKFCTGIIVFIITNDKIVNFTPDFIRWNTALIPAVSIVLAGICITFIKSQSSKDKQDQNAANTSADEQKRQLKQLEEELAQ